MKGATTASFSLFVPLLFTPSIFLSFLFSSIMFRHIHLWLQFSVAKISDTFEQHHPNPTWWHRQIPCPVYDDNPFQIFLLFALKTRIGPTRVFVMSLPSKTSSSYFWSRYKQRKSTHLIRQIESSPVNSKRKVGFDIFMNVNGFLGIYMLELHQTSGIQVKRNLYIYL